MRGRATIAGLVLALLLGLGLQGAAAQGPRKAVIIDYADGSRGLQWAKDQDGAGGGEFSAPSPAPPPVTPRSHGAPVGKGGGYGGSGGGGAAVGATGGSGRGGGDEGPPAVKPGEGVELIVGGQGKDGIAKKTRVPVVK